MSEHSRVDEFASEIEALKLKTSASGNERLLQIVGGVLMGLGVVVTMAAYVMAGGQNSGDLVIDNLEHNEHTILAVAGLALTVAGGVMFLRYGLANFFRAWLLRQIYESRALADRLER